MTAVNYLWNPINDNIVEEFDDAGNTIAEYTTESNEFGDVISQYRDGQESFYHTDDQRSTLALTNATGDVTDTYAYSAFGEVTAQTGSTVNPFQYIGQKGYYRNVENRQYSIRRRPLAAEHARWLSIDPSFSGLRPNKYVYCENSPLMDLDPSGLLVEDLARKPPLLGPILLPPFSGISLSGCSTTTYPVTIEIPKLDCRDTPTKPPKKIGGRCTDAKCPPGYTECVENFIDGVWYAYCFGACWGACSAAVDNSIKPPNTWPDPRLCVPGISKTRFFNVIPSCRCDFEKYYPGRRRR